MKKFLYIVGLFILLCNCNFLSKAHSPSNMDLDYNINSDDFYVRIYHQVPDLSLHYIESIEIWVNDVLDTFKTYTTQKTNEYHDDLFNFQADVGDIIKVRATCSISGDYTDQITVSGVVVPEFDISFPILISFLGFLSLFGIFLKKRKKRGHTSLK